MNVAGVEIVGPSPVTGGHICRTWRGHTVDGRLVFAKTLGRAPAGFFAAEAAGLARLLVDGGPRVPAVVAVAADGLVLEWVESGPPTRAAAVDLGRRLARMHTSGCVSFGAAEPGWIASLPLDNTAARHWPTFYAERRLGPFLHGLPNDVRAAVQQVIDRLVDLAGPSEPPARIHGDLWSGNLLWGSDGNVCLVDAASAHGGHRETDLAMLALFGAPYLDALMSSYDEVAPLAPGWRERQPLHQLHPLLVHARLFGGGYVERVHAIARSLVA